MLRAALCPTICLALLLGGTAALAAKPVNKSKARILFKSGKADYAAGQYREAAAKFSGAYLADPQPVFLINIAQSYRSADDLKQALYYYQEFLRTAPADSPLRTQVEDLVHELRAKVEPPPRPAPTPVVQPFVAPVAPPLAPRSAASPFYKRWWFWTAIAVVVVGTSAGLGAYAATREPSYVKEGGLGAVRW